MSSTREIRSMLTEAIKLYRRHHDHCDCFDCGMVQDFCRDALRQLDGHADAEHERLEGQPALEVQ